MIIITDVKCKKWHRCIMQGGVIRYRNVYQKQLMEKQKFIFYSA